MARRPPVVLVADDDVTILYPVTSLMQMEGYVVLSASDGNASLELSREYPGTIDLAITERPGIKALVMSGAHANELRRFAVAGPVLAKPFDGRVLKASVRALLVEGETP